MFVYSPNYLSIKGAWTQLPSPSLHTELLIVLQLPTLQRVLKAMFTQLKQCAQDHTVMGSSSDLGSEFRSLSLRNSLSFLLNQPSLLIKTQVKQVVCKIRMFYETMCSSTLRTFLLIIIMLEQTLKAHILAQTYNPSTWKATARRAPHPTRFKDGPAQSE